MAQQLIIAGFHRSGTSMLAQELYRAGLFLGKRLMPANLANVDGFYEDMDFFRLHETLLAMHRSSWRHTGMERLEVSAACREEMCRLVRERDASHSQWGFKDPRSALFLPEWYALMSSPRTVIIYRHYRETTRSLFHRAVRNWLVAPNANQLAFWQDRTLAYRMWLAYNRRLLEHARTYPETTLVVSHDAMLRGFPIVRELGEAFGLTLDPETPSAIDPAKLSARAPEPPLPDPELLRQLDEIWTGLQELSIAPAELKSSSTFCPGEQGWEAFDRHVADLGGLGREADDPLDLGMARMRSLQSDPEELIRVLRPLVPEYFGAGRQTELIRVLRSLAEEKNHAELWSFLAELYRQTRSEEDALFCERRFLDAVPKIFPRHYQKLAEGYLFFRRFDEAERFLHRALEANPANPAFYRTAASLEMARCRYAEAEEWLRSACERSSERPDEMIRGLIELRRLYERWGREEEFRKVGEMIREVGSSMEKRPPWIEREIARMEKRESQKDFSGQWRSQLLAGLRRSPIRARIVSAVHSMADEGMRHDFFRRVAGEIEKLAEEKSRKSVCIVVLGMHRSGTSCLMGSLEKHGLVPGEISTWNPFNRKGNREHFGVVALNDKVLAYNDASWDRPPETLRWDDALAAERDAILDGFLALRAPFVGFKDPRTVLTLPFWEEGMRCKGIELRPVGTFRHPAAVVASLLSREAAMSEAEALRLWKRYNETLLAHWKKRPFPFVSFDRKGEAYLRDVTDTAELLGLAAEASDAFYDPALVSNANVPSERIDDPEARVLYTRIKRLPNYRLLFARRKRLTVLVNFYNMRREAARTLRTLCPDYQNLPEKLYDVVAIDNGSTEPLDAASVEAFGSNFHYLYFVPEHPSPVEALNVCATAVRSEYVMCLIDGARMLSPGILRRSMESFGLFEHPFVYTLGMHLGDELQNIALTKGYTREKEDELLETVNWEENGYRLFRISVTAASGKGGYFAPINESNCFAMRREDFLELGGFHPGFISPGGGLANLDLFNRVHERGEFTPVLLLGEATFHQMHGGVATNVRMEHHPWPAMQEEYRRIHGKEYAPSWRLPCLFGTLDPRYHTAFIGGTDGEG